MPICIVAIVGGNCVSTTPGTLLNKKYDKNDKAQQWTIEREGDNKLAFKSESDGQYLRATAGQAYGNITVGAKQWWIAERGAAPGSFWLKCADFPDACLCNANAGLGNNNKIYCWPKQLNWAHALQWYLQDSLGGDAIPGASSSGQTAEQSAAAIAKSKEQEQALADREAALKLKEAELAEKASKVQLDQAALKTQGAGSSASQEQLKKMQDDLQQKEKDMKVLETKLKAAEVNAAQSGTVTASGASSVDASQGDAQRAQITAENERLKRELVSVKIAIGNTGSSGMQRWIPTAVKPPQRKLPPIVRPAKRLPNGFDRALIERATVTASEEVVEVDS